MAESGQLPSDGETRAADDIDEVLSRANPNPDRVGCPPRETLAALARRNLPIEDPAYGHLVKCSPCYREFRALQTERLRKTASRGAHRRGGWVWLAAAALVAVVAGGTWRTLWAPSMAAPQVGSTPGPEIQAEIDLRAFAVSRDVRDGPTGSAVSLPRGLVQVTILLPAGSEPGEYEIQLLDAALKSHTSSHGTAAIADFVTTVRSRLDLSAVPSGPYQLALRRKGDTWRLFPARVQ